MRHIKTSLILLLIMIYTQVSAQKEPIYGQYFFNNSIINPAQAGASFSSQAGLLVRNQWIGIEGAPETITLYANMSLPKQLGSAVGIYYDKAGPETSFHMQGDIAYHIRLNEEWYLSAGIRFSCSYLRIGLQDIDYVDPRNPYFMTDISSGFKLNTGVGFLAHNSKYFIGISLPRTFKTNIKATVSGNIDFQKDEVRTFFVYGGINLNLTKDLNITPSVLLRYGVIPEQLDLNAILSYKDIFDFGPLVRTNVVQSDNLFESVGFLLGIRFWKNWHLGYLYELPVTTLINASKQTHEVSLRFFWGMKENGTAGPKYFL